MTGSPSHSGSRAKRSRSVPPGAETRHWFNRSDASALAPNAAVQYNFSSVRRTSQSSTEKDTIPENAAGMADLMFPLKPSDASAVLGVSRDRN
jgi:hypothetical protein